MKSAISSILLFVICTSGYCQMDSIAAVRQFDFMRYKHDRAIKIDLMIKSQKQANVGSLVGHIFTGVGIMATALIFNADTFSEHNWKISAGSAGVALAGYLYGSFARQKADRLHGEIIRSDALYFNPPDTANRQLPIPKQVTPPNQDLISLRLENERMKQSIVGYEDKLSTQEQRLDSLTYMVKQIQDRPLPTTPTTPPQSEVFGTSLSPPVATEAAEQPIDPPKVEPQLPYRYIQFIATTGGQQYPDLDHLGTIFSERVSANVFRYKIRGRYTDADVARVISSLKKEGYDGAFESK